MKIMKYILLTFALFYLNVSIWGQEKSIGITLEDVAGMKEKEKEQEKAMRTPRNTFIVNLGYGWITSRVEMRSGTYKWKGGPSIKWRTTGLVKRVMDSDWSVQLSALIFLKKL